MRKSKRIKRFLLLEIRYIKLCWRHKIFPYPRKFIDDFIIDVIPNYPARVYPDPLSEDQKKMKNSFEITEADKLRLEDSLKPLKGHKIIWNWEKRV